MRSDVVVQRGLRTFTGPFFARFFTGIILSLVAEFAFIVPSKDGFVVFRCTLEEAQADRGLEVPAWMFDRTACPRLLQFNRMSASRHLRRCTRCSIWR